MGFLSATRSGVKAALGKIITVVTYPVVKPAEIIMSLVIKNLLLSALKGVVATLFAALGAAAGVIPGSADPVTVAIWGLVVTGIHAVQTFIQHSVFAPAVPPAAPKA